MKIIVLKHDKLLPFLLLHESLLGQTVSLWLILILLLQNIPLSSIALPFKLTECKAVLGLDVRARASF